MLSSVGLGGGVVGESVSISRFSLGSYPRSGWEVGWWVSLSVSRGSA